MLYIGLNKMDLIKNGCRYFYLQPLYKSCCIYLYIEIVPNAPKIDASMTTHFQQFNLFIFIFFNGIKIHKTKFHFC